MAEEEQTTISLQDLDPSVIAKVDSLVAQKTVEHLDQKILQQLKDLPPESAVHALGKLQTAVETSTVRNPAAYLSGVIRRIAQVTNDPNEIAASTLAPEAQAILDALYQQGSIKLGDLDPKTLKILASKPPDFQFYTMERFKDRNLASIRNMGAYFAAHVSQMQAEGGRGGGNRHPPHHRDDRHHHQHRDFHDDRRPYDDRYRGRQRSRSPPPGRGGRDPYYHQHHDGGRYGPPPPGPSYQQQPPPYQPQYAPPGAAPPAPYQQPPPAYQPQAPYQPQQPAPYIPQPVVAAAAPIQQPRFRDFGPEQRQWGVRIEEFHGLATMSKYVHPPAAIKLQKLWDVDQNKLVSLLTEASWEALAGLDAGAAVASIDETIDNMKRAPDDLQTVNAIFMTAASRYPKRPDAPTLAGVLAAASATPVQSISPAGPYVVAPIAAAAALPPQQQQQYLPPPVYHQQPPQQPLPPVYNGPPIFQGPLGSLPVSVQHHIQTQLDRHPGVLKPEHFDGEKVVDMMHKMGERDALSALDDFARNDLNGMRSITGYLIGCLKKYFKTRDGDGGGRGGGGFGPDRRGRGRGRGGDRSPRGGDRYAPY